MRHGLIGLTKDDVPPCTYIAQQIIVPAVYYLVNHCVLVLPLPDVVLF